MNADDITFGVEIETTIPVGRLEVGPHGHGYDIPELPEWKADADPSIRATRGTRACEFVSPVFKGSEGLKQCLADLAKIRLVGAKVNKSCGLHIHVGIDKNNAERAMTKSVSVDVQGQGVYRSIYGGWIVKRKDSVMGLALWSFVRWLGHRVRVSAQGSTARNGGTGDFTWSCCPLPMVGVGSAAQGRK